MVRGVEKELSGDAVRMGGEPRGYGGVGNIFSNAAAPFLVVSDLIPGCRAIVRGNFGGDAVALLSVRFGAKGNMDVVQFFRGTLAVHAFAASRASRASQIGVMGFEKKCFHADEFTLSQVM